MKQKKNKWIDKIIVIAMILALVMLVFYVYDRRVQECTHNPLVFAAELYEKNYDAKVYGTLTLMPPEGTKFVKPTNIFFNSTMYEVLK